MKKVCRNINNPREGKTVYIGTTWRNVNTENKGEICVRAVYEIIERTLDPNGQFLLEPEQEINLYLTSLDLSDEDVIELYHNHAVCEQYHSEIKTDMDYCAFSGRKMFFYIHCVCCKMYSRVISYTRE